MNEIIFNKVVQDLRGLYPRLEDPAIVEAIKAEITVPDTKDPDDYSNVRDQVEEEVRGVIKKDLYKDRTVAVRVQSHVLLHIGEGVSTDEVLKGLTVNLQIPEHAISLVLEPAGSKWATLITADSKATVLYEKHDPHLAKDKD